MRIYKKILIASVVVAALVVPLAVGAVELLPECATGVGRCHLNDIVQMFVNFARLLLGIVGSAVLVFFVYGGFVWLTSGGEASKVQKGKDIVVNTIIGLIIVFGAFTIIQFVSESLGVKEAARVGQPCDRDGSPGVYVLDPEDSAAPPQCVTECTDALLSQLGYRCMNPAEGESCVPGICGVGADNVCCLPAGS